MPARVVTSFAAYTYSRVATWRRLPVIAINAAAAAEVEADVQ